VPGRRKDLAQVGIKAMVGGIFACYMTGCVVGFLL
jgi:nucleoside permease NupC